MSNFAALSDDDDLEVTGSSRKRPRLDSTLGYKKALKISAGVHGGLLLFVIIQSLVFPSRPKPYIPTLRVDMVALPDVLKKDLSNPAVAQSSKEIEEAIKNAEKEAKKVKPIKPVEKAEPDEMVLKPKHATSDDEKPAKREKKLMSALDRIKALEKIESSQGTSRAAIIKGNKISKGTSLSGDAKEAAEASYYDTLRARLQDNWELPVWIARQNLDAQVRVFIDSDGRVRSYRFMKSSGNDQFDSAIKKTLEESQPLPKPPEGLASSVLVDGVLVGFPL